MNNILSPEVPRCNNHRCEKRNRCSRYLQLQIDTKNYTDYTDFITLPVEKFEGKDKDEKGNHCTNFIEFDDNN